MERSAPRVVEADRSQLELRPFDLDSPIPQDHRARLVWRAVEMLDLSGFYERIKSRVGTAGRPPDDPKVFVALWLYATMDGVGAAREVERLCREHRAYRWICGGVAVNYHTLSDFRVEHGAALDELLTQTIAVLMERKLVEVKRVTQNGLRVRASAGSGSFRRKKKLRQYLEEARAQVEAVKALATDAMGVTLYGAVVERCGKDPFQPQMTDSAALSALRARMGSPEGQEIYKQRSQLSERVNADVRTYRTMDRMLVRGVGKVLCVALWNALALNLIRWSTLGPTG